MPRVYKIAICTFILAILPLELWSHGGKLNSLNCHSDNKLQENHCHKTPEIKQPNLDYDRADWRFESSKSESASSVIGWYTDIYNEKTDVDHVVALKDAFHSGGHKWTADKKKKFANDQRNHVAAIPYVNRVLKNAHTPLKFVTNMKNSNYSFADGKCIEFIKLYASIKRLYGLHFKNNDITQALEACNSRPANTVLTSR